MAKQDLIKINPNLLVVRCDIIVRVKDVWKTFARFNPNEPVEVHITYPTNYGPDSLETKIVKKGREFYTDLNALKEYFKDWHPEYLPAVLKIILPKTKTQINI